MVKQLIEFDYDGLAVYAEIDEDEPVGGFERAGFFRTKGLLPTKKASVSLDQAFSIIKATAQAVTDQICSLSVKPQTAEVSFGLSLKAEIGAVLASAGVAANLNVKLAWDFSHE